MTDQLDLDLGDTVAMKRCPQCGINKPRATEFGVRRNGFSRSWCRACETAKFAESYHADQPKHAASYWRSWLKRNYGLTPEKFQALLDAQGGRCAICGSDEPGRGRKFLCVDHDHETGEVRGLLCNTCNRALGLFGDNLAALEQAVAYLHHPPAQLAIPSEQEETP